MVRALFLIFLVSGGSPPASGDVERVGGLLFDCRVVPGIKTRSLPIPARMPSKNVIGGRTSCRWPDDSLPIPNGLLWRARGKAPAELPEGAISLVSIKLFKQFF